MCYEGNIHAYIKGKIHAKYITGKSGKVRVKNKLLIRSLINIHSPKVSCALNELHLN